MDSFGVELFQDCKSTVKSHFIIKEQQLLPAKCFILEAHHPTAWPSPLPAACPVELRALCSPVLDCFSSPSLVRELTRKPLWARVVLPSRVTLSRMGIWKGSFQACVRGTERSIDNGAVQSTCNFLQGSMGRCPGLTAIPADKRVASSWLMHHCPRWNWS